MIPATAHFIWIGSDFHWLSWAAVVSAARRGGFESVILHHTHDLSASPWWRALAREPHVMLARLDAPAVLEGASGSKLVDVYRGLRTHAARSNVLRVAILARRGGVYLDLDTVTLRSLAPLCEAAGFFCGAERVAFPATVRRSRDPRRWIGALVRSAVRDVLRRSHRGIAGFRRIEHHYPAAANNAVLGSTPGHAVLRALLESMQRLPAAAARRRFALGTTLLQTTLARVSAADVVIHAPDVFYPLGPELSQHWFRGASAASLDQVLTPRTRVVHWYASVRTRHLVPRIDAQWLERQPPGQLLNALLRRALGGARVAAGEGIRNQAVRLEEVV